MTPTLLTPAEERIRCLNDRLRTHFIGGQVMITQGVQALGTTFRAECIEAIRSFASFDPEDDPDNRHDFGAVTVQGRRVYWKIDYYDRALEYGSPDPSDPSVTTRVLTILLPLEY
jgi:hypothetical protein